MATRRCLRCCKLVPETAAFCRRCGLSLGTTGDACAGRDAAAGGFEPPPVPQLCRRGRGSGLGVLTSFLAVAAGLALLTASTPSSRQNLVCRDAVGRVDLPAHFSHPAPPPAWDDRPSAADEYDADALAAARRQIAAATERLAAARQKVDDARRRFEASRRLPPGPAPGYPSAESQSPWITEIEAGPARAGGKVTIRGRGLTNPRRVVFAAGPQPGAGAVRADARFEVRGDGMLVAQVPDLGRRRREVAIIVLTPGGAAVTAPDDRGSPSFQLVSPGTRLTPETGATLFVDRDATVASAAGSVVLVRAGGTVDRAWADCLVVRETPNPVAWDLKVTPVIDVPALNACAVDSLFQYAGR